MPTASMHPFNAATMGIRSTLGSSTSLDRLGPASAAGSSASMMTSGQSFVAQLAEVLDETRTASSPILSSATSSRNLSGDGASSTFTRMNVLHDPVVAVRAQAAGMRKETQASQPEAGNQIMQPASTATVRTPNRSQANDVTPAAATFVAVPSQDDAGTLAGTAPLVSGAVQDSRPIPKHATSRVAESGSDDSKSNTTAHAIADVSNLSTIMIAPDLQPPTRPTSKISYTEPAAGPVQLTSTAGIDATGAIRINQTETLNGALAVNTGAGSVPAAVPLEPLPAIGFARTEAEADPTWTIPGQAIDVGSFATPGQAADASMASGPGLNDTDAGRQVATMVATPVAATVAQAVPQAKPVQSSVINVTGIGTSSQAGRSGTSSGSGNVLGDTNSGLLGTATTGIAGINVLSAATSAQAANSDVASGSSLDAAQPGMSAAIAIPKAPAAGSVQTTPATGADFASVSASGQAAGSNPAPASGFMPNTAQPGMSVPAAIQAAPTTASTLPTPIAGIDITSVAEPNQTASFNLAPSSGLSAEQPGMSVADAAQATSATNPAPLTPIAAINITSLAAPDQAASSSLAPSPDPHTAQPDMPVAAAAQAAPATGSTQPTLGINVTSLAVPDQAASFSLAPSPGPSVPQPALTVAAAPAQTASATVINVALTGTSDQSADLRTTFSSDSTPHAAAASMSPATVTQASSLALPSGPATGAAGGTEPVTAPGANASATTTRQIPAASVSAAAPPSSPAPGIAASSSTDDIGRTTSAIDMNGHDTTAETIILPLTPVSTTPVLSGNTNSAQATAISMLVDNATFIGSIVQPDASATSSATAVPVSLEGRAPGSDVASASTGQPMVDALLNHRSDPGGLGQQNALRAPQQTQAANVPTTRASAAISVIDQDDQASVTEVGTPASSSMQSALPVFDTHAGRPAAHDGTADATQLDVGPAKPSALPTASASSITPTINPTENAIADIAVGQTGSTIQPAVSDALPMATGATQALALPTFLPPEASDTSGAPTQVAASLLTLGSSPDGSSQLTVSLHPKELGSVQVQMDRSADGTVRIVVAASEPGTLRSLMTSQAHLHAALDAASVPTANRHLSFELTAPAVVSTHVGAVSIVDRQPETPRVDSPTSNQTGADLSGSRNFDQQDQSRSQDDRPGSAQRARSSFDETGDVDTTGRFRSSTLTPSSLRSSAGSINITA